MARKATKKRELTPLSGVSREEFEALAPVHEALRQEVMFILQTALDKTSIKIHQIESRVKEFDSLSKKLASGSYEHFTDIPDLVGARIICLFKSDLDDVTEIIRRSFDVLSEDNKIDANEDSFGYMSIHFNCRMPKRYKGPRYVSISQHAFEIQLRTICMHAWAVISHYLDYKTELDIPAPLRKGLNALSGLFYVADTQYEQLFSARERIRELNDSKSSDESQGLTINLDTVSSMLKRVYPDRDVVDPQTISIFVRELIANGYNDIGKVEKEINAGRAFLKQYEKRLNEDRHRDPGLPYFANLGAARVTLKGTKEGYIELSYRETAL